MKQFVMTQISVRDDKTIKAGDIPTVKASSDVEIGFSLAKHHSIIEVIERVERSPDMVIWFSPHDLALIKGYVQMGANTLEAEYTIRSDTEKENDQT